MVANNATGCNSIIQTLEEYMKRSIVTFAAVMALVVILAGCDTATETGKNPVVIGLTSGLESADARVVSSGQSLDSISAYRVVFKKIEIGNSESDKCTLWENTEGETKDVSHPVIFDNVQPINPGTYNYVRLTIGETLSVDGSLTDPADTTLVYTGTGTCILTSSVYLWGTNIENAAGEVTIQAPIVIEKGTALSILFDIAGTVAYAGGPASGATFSVTKPVLILVAE